MKCWMRMNKMEVSNCLSEILNQESEVFRIYVVKAAKTEGI